MFVAPNQKLSVDMVVFYAVSQRTDIVKDKNIISSLHLLTCLVDMVEPPLSVCGCHNIIKNPAPPMGFFVRFWLHHIT